MTEERLNEIEQRVLRATAGPWKSYIEGRDHLSGSSFIMTGPAENRQQDIELLGATSDDQDFIANSRQDIVDLIAEIRRLKAERQEKG